MQETYQAVIVEDDPMIASIDQNFLERDPRFHLAASFRSGQDALPWLLRHPADLLILDVYMPRMTGLELLRELRSFGITSDVVMVTAANDSKTVDALLKLGVADYLVKPFTPRRFQQASGPVHREDHPASVAEDRNVNLPFCRPKADVTGPSPSRICLPVSGQMPVLNLIGGNSSALFSLVLQGFHHHIQSSAVPAEAKICRIPCSRRVDHFHYAALRIQRQGIDSLRASARIGAHIYICSRSGCPIIFHRHPIFHPYLFTVSFSPSNKFIGSYLLIEL